MYDIWTATGADSIVGNVVNPICLIFWSTAELGDVWLFYHRYVIVKVTPIERWFKVYFGFWLICAFIVRGTDIVISGVQGAIHSTSAGVQYIEPTYFVCILFCEIILQVRYVLAITSLDTVTKVKMFATLARSAGARFLLVTVPMLARTIAEYTAPVGDPSVIIAVNFSTAVNLFTMFDLLLMKYELTEVVSGSSRATKTIGENTKQKKSNPVSTSNAKAEVSSVSDNV
jgi:hypothetical protein